MSEHEWQALFKPKTKEEWIHKINTDAKGSFSEEQLINNFGEGVHMHAVHTRQDLADLPHLSHNSAYTRIKWSQDQKWTIGYPVYLESNVTETIDHLKAAASRYAEAIVIEPSPLNTSPPTFDQVNELLSACHEIGKPVHVRFPPELTQHIKTNWNQVLPPQSSLHTFAIHPLEAPISQLPPLLTSTLDSVQFSPFDAVTCYIPDHASDETSSLGSVLLSLESLVRLAQNEPMEFDMILPQLRFQLNAGLNFYLDIARIRALRYVVARFMHEHFPKFNEDLDIPIHAEIQSSSASQETIADFLLEATTKSIAAVLGGCSMLIIRPSLHTAVDERLEALRLGTNLQLLLRHEAHLDHVHDPASGSYYIEVLTSQLIQSAWEYYERKR